MLDVDNWMGLKGLTRGLKMVKIQTNEYMNRYDFCELLLERKLSFILRLSSVFLFDFK